MFILPISRDCFSHNFKLLTSFIICWVFVNHSLYLPHLKEVREGAHFLNFLFFTICKNTPNRSGRMDVATMAWYENSASLSEEAEHCCFKWGHHAFLGVTGLSLAATCLRFWYSVVLTVYISTEWKKTSNVFYRTSVLIMVRSFLVKQKAEEYLFRVISYGNKASKVCLSVCVFPCPLISATCEVEARGPKDN